MKSLILKFKVVKWFFISTSPLLALLLGLIISTHFHKTTSVFAQTAPDPNPECVARGLTTYMNTVVGGAKDFSNLQLLSPAFNLTNETEARIFDLMETYGANFAELDGFAGNSYNSVGGRNVYASSWYKDHPWLGRTWQQRFKYRPFVFTEFGDFDLSIGDQTGTRSLLVSNIAGEFDLAAAEEEVMGINLFAAIGDPGYSNIQFIARHSLDPFEYQEITRNNTSKAGVNSAMDVTPGNFVNYAVDNYSSNVHWVVEIARSGSDDEIDRVVDFAEAAFAKGVTPVLRICYKDGGCGFEQADAYVNFLSQINTRLSGSGKQLFVLTGPNEPATELWATRECTPVVPFNVNEVACSDPGQPNFHSLRPYPASATCTITSQKAMLCGNDFVLTETFSVTPGQATSCEPLNPANPAEGQRCTFQSQRLVNIAVDLSNARLPIMGNTELVPNATGNANQLSFGERMANYVSWYLNGAIQRAEDPFLSASQPDDASDLIDFSGPLRKSLPSSIQNGYNYKRYYLAALFNIVEIGSYNVIPGLRLKQALLADDGVVRHDQIGACGSLDAPTPCYPDNPVRNLITQIAKAVENWYPNQNLGTITGAFNSKFFNGLQLEPTNAFNYIPFSSTEDLESKTRLRTTGTSITSGDVQITNLDLEILGPGNEDDNLPGSLFFPHMQESYELAEQAQNTFIPKDSRAIKDNILTRDIAPAQSNDRCVYVDTRTNPGDSLYGDVQRVDGNNEPQTTGSVSYTATFQCEFRPTIDQNLYNQCYSQGYCTSVIACPGVGIPAEDGQCSDPNDVVCLLPPPEPGVFSNPFCREQATTFSSCTKTVEVPLKMDVETPWADQIWARLVAGPVSVFRRFFPKTGIGAPVEEIQDLPAETQVTYGAAGIGSQVSVVAGDGRSPDSASLYFPHIGGIQEYFLNGLQKALLPYGGSLPSGPPGGEVPTPESGLANCDPNVPNSSVPSQYLSRKSIFIDLADRWVTTDNNSHNAARCFNDVVVRSLAAGINPFFTLAIWVNESDASNYLASSTAWEDFGIHTAGNPEDFNSQINLFLQLAQNGVYQTSYPQCFGGNYSDMQTFMFIFHMGPAQCLNNDLVYYNAIFATNSTTTPGNGPWSWVSGANCIPSYPSDMNCP